MENNSFIPKQYTNDRPAIVRSKTTDPTTSVYFLVSLIVFFVVISYFGVIKFNQSNLTKALEEKKQQLVENRSKYNPAVIEGLTRNERRLASARQVIENHLMLSQVMILVEELTQVDIYFKSFEYQFGGDDQDDLLRAVQVNGAVVVVTGIAPTFAELVQQTRALRDDHRIKIAEIVAMEITDESTVGFDIKLIVEDQVVFGGTSDIVPVQDMVNSVDPVIEFAAPEGVIQDAFNDQL